jgi:hypothetical protein
MLVQTPSLASPNESGTGNRQLDTTKVIRG